MKTTKQALGRLLTAVLLSVAVCGAAAAPAPKPQGRLDTTFGPIVIQLEPARAAKTVADFLRYVKSGSSDGTIFHRVIAGFMIEGRGYTASYRRIATGRPIPNEADNGLKNRAGAIAMARTPAVLKKATLLAPQRAAVEGTKAAR